MEIRRLLPEEKFEARLIGNLAFHGRMEDPEKEKRESLTDPTEDWGVFDEDGRLMAHMYHPRFLFRLDGQWVPSGGIGAVSTLPEYRNRGAIRAIFTELFREAYREGEVLSCLYPFNHAFYRKFGYETVRWRDEYRFSPKVLREYRFTGRAVPWRSGDSAAVHTALYEKFASDFNLAIHRDEKRMLDDHIRMDWIRDTHFTYLLYEGDVPLAYLTCMDIRKDSYSVLSVRDYAWDGKAGFQALLGFLARFSADYRMIEIHLPVAVELDSLIHSPDVYSIEQSAVQDYMIRVVNAEKLLGILHKPHGCTFVIRVRDAMIPENNGTWEVGNDGVRPSGKAPDLAVSVQALGQLACGSVSLAESRLREDVEVAGNEEVLRTVFVRKPILVEDHY
ncbi:MAG: GNAT family N-acetyltransferase [Clostridia bacterium]|nr:GNAT family N-acetyltransferase [Clostridia bacterium]